MEQTTSRTVKTFVFQGVYLNEITTVLWLLLLVFLQLLTDCQEKCYKKCYKTQLESLSRKRYRQEFFVPSLTLWQRLLEFLFFQRIRNFTDNTSSSFHIRKYGKCCQFTPRDFSLNFIWNGKMEKQCSNHFQNYVILDLKISSGFTFQYWKKDNCKIT